MVPHDARSFLLLARYVPIYNISVITVILRNDRPLFLEELQTAISP